MNENITRGAWWPNPSIVFIGPHLNLSQIFKRLPCISHESFLIRTFFTLSINVEKMYIGKVRIKIDICLYRKGIAFCMPMCLFINGELYRNTFQWKRVPNINPVGVMLSELKNGLTLLSDRAE